MKKLKKKILIISGGISKEREISLQTGSQVAKELKKNGYSNIDGVDFSQDMLDLVPKKIYKKIEKIAAKIGEAAIKTNVLATEVCCIE